MAAFPVRYRGLLDPQVRTIGVAHHEVSVTGAGAGIITIPRGKMTSLYHILDSICAIVTVKRISFIRWTTEELPNLETLRKVRVAFSATSFEEQPKKALKNKVAEERPPRSPLHFTQSSPEGRETSGKSH